MGGNCLKYFGLYIYIFGYKLCYLILNRNMSHVRIVFLVAYNFRNPGDNLGSVVPILGMLA